MLITLERLKAELSKYCRVPHSRLSRGELLPGEMWEEREDGEIIIKQKGEE